MFEGLIQILSIKEFTNVINCSNYIFSKIYEGYDTY